MLKILVINSDYGPDYMADLFLGEMIFSEEFQLHTNHLQDYMFSDFPASVKIYGNGYTVFKKISPDQKKSIVLEDDTKIEYGIAHGKYDLIIYTSIWRCHKHLNLVLSTYEKSKIIVIDGEDDPKIANIAPKVTYYKRELESKYLDYCKPISFGFPSYFEAPITGNWEEKSVVVAPCNPLFRKSYIFNEETLYYEQYAKSLFAVTTKKAGWDCMRHYEIIASGCLPYFPDIDKKPMHTMQFYPIELQKKINHIFLQLIIGNRNLDNYKNEWLDLNHQFESWLKIFGRTSILLKLLR